MKICIDPGHGGVDTGAIGPSGLMEKEAVLDIAKFMRFGLAPQHEVCMTRDVDAAVGLNERCEYANFNESDLFLSIHANSAVNPAAHGFEVWTSPGWTPSDPIATQIFNTVRECFPKLSGRVDSSDGDPDKESRFRVLMGTHMPAVLIETAFICNATEEGWLRDRGWRMRMAGAIVSSIWRL